MSIITQTLLIELGTEELPPKSLKKLAKAFSSTLFEELIAAQLITSPDAGFKWYASPRRLAIVVPDVAEQQATQQVERRGPAVKAAFKEDGSPTPAALGFAKSCGTEIDQLKRLQTDKGEWLFFEQEVAGKTANDLVSAALEVANKKLPIAKRMRWGNGSAEFVRPVHWLLALHGANTMPMSILDVSSNNITYGHRFHSTGKITIKHADDYVSTLENTGSVIADFELRQQQISTQIKQLADSVKGHTVTDQALLDEVTALVEHPNALIGKIDAEFMSVPQECLISSMRDHQKYFHLVDEANNLLPYFITVANINSKNPAQVINGNERVLRARLSDAKFFWDNDRKTPLIQRIEKLNNVLFHVKLGSIADKTARVKNIAQAIAQHIGADVSIATRAAELTKADLVSDMVGEFPELQGTMGHYYADLDGEQPLVGDCIEQHYWPKYAGDQLPTSKEAQAVALAEKLDSLVGIFGAGEIPTGDKDPYGLRRAALGILRIIIEQDLALSLNDIVALSSDAYAQQNIPINAEQQTHIVTYLLERLRAYYQAQNIETSRINAVLEQRPVEPLDFDARLHALNSFMQLDQATDLAAANKRISNILRKASFNTEHAIDATLFTEEAESALFAAMQKIETECINLFAKGDYTAGLQKLASLRDPIDVYFDTVMVMSDDAAVKENRLAMLFKLQSLFMHVADISALS